MNLNSLPKLYTSHCSYSNSKLIKFRLVMAKYLQWVRLMMVALNRLRVNHSQLRSFLALISIKTKMSFPTGKLISFSPLKTTLFLNYCSFKRLYMICSEVTIVTIVFDIVNPFCVIQVQMIYSTVLFIWLPVIIIAFMLRAIFVSNKDVISQAHSIQASLVRSIWFSIRSLSCLM